MLLLLALIIVGCGIYLNFVGLPDFLKRPLLTKLRGQGMQMEFSNMQWRWPDGIVVKNSSLTLLKPALKPKFSSDDARLDFDLGSLFTSHPWLNSITLQKGNLLWPLSKTNASNLVFSNITARINYPSPSDMRITQLEGDFHATRFKIDGVLTNFADAQAWPIFRSRPPEKDRRGFHKLRDALLAARFTGQPELILHFAGDAKVPSEITGAIYLVSGTVETSWGNATNLHVSAVVEDLLGGTKNNFAQLEADFLDTKWARGSNVNCQLKLLSSPANDIFETEIEFSAQQFQADYGQAAAVELTARTSQTLSNWIPLKAAGKARLQSAETKWGKLASAEVDFLAATNPAPQTADAGWAQWRKAEPYLLNWEGRFAGVERTNLNVEKLSLSGSWAAPQLCISNLDAQLYTGGILATGRLNVATRESFLEGTSDFDVQKISSLLPDGAQHWVSKFQFDTPPKLRGTVGVILPSWTNRAPNWEREVLPTLELKGNVFVGSGSYREVPVTSAKTDFAYSNRVWTLPNLRIERREGGADLQFISDENTRDFHWLIHSEIDPRAIRHLLTEPAQQALDFFQFTTPPDIHADLRGKWDESEKLSGAGDITLKNVSFRSNAFEKFSCSLQLTNQLLRAAQMRLGHAGKFSTAQEIALDFPTKRLYFTNIHSTIDPYLFTRLIGKKVAEAIAPYQFLEPPTLDIHGGLTIGTVDDADLHFLVDGTQFRWGKILADHGSGRVDWVGRTLLVTNVLASLYQGRAAGWTYFDFSPDQGADYRFELAVADVDLQTAVKSLKGKTNQLEGQLYGQITVASANLKDLKSIRAKGKVNVREGLLWDVPLFGIFSPILNAIVPGAGNSRAHEAAATFVVKGGIVSTDDLEIRAPTLRIQYRGGVDFQQNIDARVEAELLRDTWVIGRLVSLALSPLTKLFEYKVTGTLAHPEREPVYIPNFLMMTLRPFHSMKKAIAPEKQAPVSNAEPAR
ncbi:MAG: hypothetical protein ABI042_05075 [Verrucomicrobiota bacterium]